MRADEPRDIAFRRIILSIPPGKVSTYGRVLPRSSSVSKGVLTSAPCLKGKTDDPRSIGDRELQ
jgi:hypothetical protein